MDHQNGLWHKWVWVGLAGLLLGGCGTGAYRQRMEKRMEQLRRGVPGQAELSEAVQLPGTPLEIRVPKGFLTALSPQGGSEHPARRTPPFPLPGLLGAWEAHGEQGGQKMPYYLYLGLVEKSQNPQQLISQRIHQEWQDAPGDWKDFPDAEQRGWKRCQVVLADLEWVPLDSNGKELPVQKATGIMDIFCLQEGQHWILVACRVPQSMASQVRMEDIYRVLLANLKIKS